MNDSTSQSIQRLKQMLENATAADTSAAGNTVSAGHSTSESHDAETASLREAWLAFGQLIRAADASLAAMPNIATPPPKPRRSRWLGLVAAAAAALLVAVTFGWCIGRNAKPDNREPSLVQRATPARPNPQPENKTASPAPAVKQDLLQTAVVRAEKATNEQPKTATATTSTWDDPLETQIASVSQQISNVEQNWQHRVDDVDLVQYRIDAVSESLQDDKL